MLSVFLLGTALAEPSNNFTILYHSLNKDSVYEEISVKEKQFTAATVVNYYDRWALFLTDKETPIEDPCTEHTKSLPKWTLAFILKEKPEDKGFKKNKYRIKISEVISSKEGKGFSLSTKGLSRRKIAFTGMEGDTVKGSVKVKGSLKVKDPKTFKYTGDKQEFLFVGDFEATYCR